MKNVFLYNQNKQVKVYVRKKAKPWNMGKYTRARKKMQALGNTHQCVGMQFIKDWILSN